MASASASASTLHTNPTVSKTFDFANADVFCTSYCDELNQDLTTANGLVSNSDPSVVKDHFSKDFQESRMARSYSPTAVYDHPNESLYQETISAVENCMKRHTGDIMRFLEGISSRLSHLELYCYNVDKSVGEMRSNLGRDYEETDLKLTSLEKKLAEVSRSIQILRDKQDLAETQKELAKLQLAQKKLASPTAPRHIVEQTPSPTSETSEVEKQHLAIILRQQGAPQPYSPPVRPVEVPRPVPIAPSQNAPRHVTHPQHYYLTSAPFQVHAQASQGLYLTSDVQYQSSQPLQQDMKPLQQDVNLLRLRPVSAHVTQQEPPPLVHRFIQYQQPSQQPHQMYSSTQLSTQQPPTLVQSRSTQLSTQQPPTPVQSRPDSASGYLPLQPSQHAQQAPQEAVPGTVHMTATLSDMSSQTATRVDVLPNGYVRRQAQPLPLTQQIKTNYGSPLENRYASVGPHQSLSTGTYVMHRSEDATRQLPHQSQGSYPPANAPVKHSQHVSLVRNHSQPQFARNHPKTDLTEKLVNMGFRAEHVVAVIRKMEESGQAVDSNAVVDTLNAQSFGFHRGWTG